MFYSDMALCCWICASVAYTNTWRLIFFSFLSLINADFCVAGCLIAYGAVLGKVSPVQLMVMTLFGITLFAVEEYIILNLIHVSWNNFIPDLIWFIYSYFRCSWWCDNNFSTAPTTVEMWLVLSLCPHCVTWISVCLWFVVNATSQLLATYQHRCNPKVTAVVLFILDRD